MKERIKHPLNESKATIKMILQKGDFSSLKRMSYRDKGMSINQKQLPMKHAR